MLKRDKKERKPKDPHAVHLGQLGGKARGKKLRPEERREIARKAAAARWGKEKKKETGGEP